MKFELTELMNVEAVKEIVYRIQSKCVVLHHLEADGVGEVKGDEEDEQGTRGRFDRVILRNPNSPDRRKRKI
ncbi:hypothetical protein MA16_Dca002904 [Dendrobium catenatum]|uniref:Uncharacterized protein n=1 Tax=Dendrobium catenatum TaxID=906689 RepID=A0A2I0X910_9ASPA|nr:hypothetical protein MA16_Dca002904 [Dendrobium catenatum]